MSECPFIDKLSKLRKSSSDSIDDVDSFDEFKEYMHVVRTAETDLKDILRKTKASTAKTMIMLCGSAGDGKSHLLSYLKNHDSENLLDGFIVINDATESNAPTKTAIETLNETLSGFSDLHLNEPGKNIIVAINLGVLSNFIESDFAVHYTALRDYVFGSSILSSSINDLGFVNNSHFQHVSFSDYHMYLLGKDGPIPAYIESLFEKIVDPVETNPFYSSYLTHCGRCPLCTKCPVKKNYEYFSNQDVRKYISSLLVSLNIRDKEILTTRELLNCVYDFLVAKDFSVSKLQNSSLNQSAFIHEYITEMLPSLLFDSIDVSTIMTKMNSYDPVLVRNECADDLAIEYYVAEDVTNIIQELQVDSPYTSVILQSDVIELVNEDRTLKSQLFSLLIRMRAISLGLAYDRMLSRYIQDLYYFNAGMVPKLGDLYASVEDAVVNWCGSEGEGTICIDDHHKDLSLYEKISFEPCLENIPSKVDEGMLYKFIPYLIVEYNDSSNTPIRLDIDYSLYELISKLKAGYIPTAKDRNDQAGFVGFIAKLLKTGNADKFLTVTSIDGKKAVLEKTKFGVFKFKVVK